MSDVNGLQRAMIQMRDCKLCKQFINRKKVFPKNLNGTIMVISDCPAEEEEKLHIPIAGETLEFFERCLAKAGFNREQIYYTTVLKCRPPASQICGPFASDWLSNCRNTFLYKEIRLLNPTFIITLGNFAINSFVYTDSIIKSSGTIITVNGGIKSYPLGMLVHPNWILRKTIEEQHNGEYVFVTQLTNFKCYVERLSIS